MKNRVDSMGEKPCETTFAAVATNSIEPDTEPMQQYDTREKPYERSETDVLAQLAFSRLYDICVESDVHT